MKVELTYKNGLYMGTYRGKFMYKMTHLDGIARITKWKLPKKRNDRPVLDLKKEVLAARKEEWFCGVIDREES